jgi:Dolichyl-phosphate-mannose-protein mannosyltransferase
LRFVLVAYGFVNALLYCALLPLWEGFDEPFHYGYVQEVANRGGFPVFGKTTLSEEIWSSLLLAPVSHAVRRNIPALMTYDEYFALGRDRRALMHAQLDHLPASLRFVNAESHPNYEAHQAPLAYLFLAAFDRLWSASPLVARVWRLRIVAAWLSVLGTWLGVLYLARQLGLEERARWVLLFLVFSTQMFYATVCHVANDWLSVPLSVALIALCVRFYEEPNMATTILLALLLGGGLLAKSYFLAFAPAVCGLAAWRLLRRRRTTEFAVFLLILLAIAGPWHARNLRLYHSLSGMAETASGLGPQTVIAAVPAVPWMDSVGFIARGSLWTANNSFSTFSRATLNAMIVLIMLGLAALLGKWRRENSTGILVVLAMMFAYGGGLIYATTQSFVFTKGQSIGASAWYAQPLLAPVLCLALLGAHRLGHPGRWLTVAMIALWMYVQCASYAVKLIPLYGGFSGGRSSPGAIWEWYRLAWADSFSRLGNVTLLSPALVLVLAAAVILLDISIGVGLCRWTIANDGHTRVRRSLRRGWGSGWGF